MKKHKVILLPADERILKLHVTDKNISNKIPINVRIKITWRQTIQQMDKVFKVSVILLLVSVPSLFYLITGFTVYGLLFLLKGKAHAKQWNNWWGKQLEKVNPNKPPFGWTIKSYDNSIPKPDEEDVPGFLTNAGKYGYKRIVYLSKKAFDKKERLDELQRMGMIDDVLAYDETTELYDYIQNEDILQEYSWIIHLFDENVKNISTENNNLYVCKSNDSAHHYKNSILGSFKKCGNRIMFSRVKLTYNGMIDESMVLYFETEYNPQVNGFIRKNYHAIQEKLAAKDLRLLYFPVLSKKNGIHIEIDDVLLYLLPDLFSGDKQLDESTLEGWMSELDLQQLYDFIKSLYRIPDGPSPAFLHCVQNLSREDLGKEVMYSYSPIWGNTEGQLQQEIDHYIEYISHPKDHVYFSLAKRVLPGEDGYDPDNEFYWEGSQLSEDIKGKIREIKKKTGEERVIETLFHIIHEFRDKNPELCRKLCRQLYEEAGEIHRKQSRIFIDKHHRIFLLDYGNIEIELTPLPKTLFFFMLKYPEGIMFKELYKYKQELLYIYGKIGNRTDLEQMQKSINDMTDATSNSVNEKCSRIKEAFISKIDERIASSYFVTGNRQEPKRITIDRSLVVFEELI